MSGRSRPFRGRRMVVPGALLAELGTLGAVGVVVTDQPHRTVAVTRPQAVSDLRLPSETVTAHGLTFVRRDKVPFVLTPGQRPGQPAALYVTVPVTWFPDGACAQMFVPIVSSEGATSVTLTTWEYTPSQTVPVVYCGGLGHGDHVERLDLARPLGTDGSSLTASPAQGRSFFSAPSPRTTPRDRTW